MSKLIDLTGMKFGRLTVIARAENDKQGKARWLCSCECGNKVIVEGAKLRRGQKACSCLIKEGNRKTHGMTNSKIYNTWMSIKQRCLNPERKDYNRYGGRGITVYPAWIDSKRFTIMFQRLNILEKKVTVSTVSTTTVIMSQIICVGLMIKRKHEILVKIL